MVFKEKYRNTQFNRKELKKLKQHFGYEKTSSLAWLYNTEKKTIPIDKAYKLAEYFEVNFIDLFDFRG